MSAAATPTLSDLRKWTNVELKDYLRRRGKKVSGNKEELANRVHTFWGDATVPTASTEAPLYQHRLPAVPPTPEDEGLNDQQPPPPSPQQVS